MTRNMEEWRAHQGADPVIVDWPTHEGYWWRLFNWGGLRGVNMHFVRQRGDEFVHTRSEEIDCSDVDEDDLRYWVSRDTDLTSVKWMSVPYPMISEFGVEDGRPTTQD